MARLRSVRLLVFCASLVLVALGVPANAMRSGPLRIVLLVDSSSAVGAILPQVRAGLNAVIDGVPPDSEIAIVSTGGQMRIRQQPTTDRKKLHDIVGFFAADGGASALIDSLIESDDRLLKKAPDRVPVFVVLAVDTAVTTAEQRIDAYNRFAADFASREGIAHILVLKGRETGIATDVALNLTRNTGGLYEPIAVATAIPDKLKAFAERLTLDYIPR
jgi:hypothetical protein